MPTDLAQNYRVDPAELPAEAVIFGCTSEMLEIRKTIDREISSDVPVLIQGESGTGKELIARYIHAQSSRRSEPFVKLNCAAIPASLLESSLFGYQKGSFPGAAEDRPGLIELANGGTLFLDDIGELHSSVQVKLLQVLPDGRLPRVDGSKERNERPRIICASNIDLRSAVEEGAFCEDLFSRIHAVSIRLLPLRERKADIPQLSRYLVQKLARRFERAAPWLGPGVLDLLMQWDWPGNLRELENWIARAIILGNTETLEAELKRRLGSGDYGNSPRRQIRTLQEASRQAIAFPSRAMMLKVLRAHQWNRHKAAVHLNMSYRSLLSEMHENGILQRRRLHRGLPPRGQR